MLKAITFDLWNTLLVEKSFTERRLEILAEALNEEGQVFDEGDLERAYAAAQERHTWLWTGEHCHYSLTERIDDILKRIRATLSPPSKRAVMDKFGDVILDDPPSLTSGAADTVVALSANFKLGIISDTGVTSGAKIRELLKREGVIMHFSSTIFSDESGLCKPRREVFESALSGLGVRTDEAMHVGDLLRTDIAGAKVAGMMATWLKVREPDATGVAPDFIITNLPELLDLPPIRETLQRTH